MTAVYPRQYWGGHTDTEDTDPADEDWIQLHAKWFFLGLGLVLGAILVVCLYINWRGPTRRLFPCLGPRDRDGVEETAVEADQRGGGGDEVAHADGSSIEEKARATDAVGQKGFIAGSGSGSDSVVSAQEVRLDKRTSRKLHKARSPSVASCASPIGRPGQTASGRRNTLGGSSPASTLPPYPTDLYPPQGRPSMPDNRLRRVEVRSTTSSFGHSPSVAHASFGSFGPMTPAWQLPPMSTQPPLVYSPHGVPSEMSPEGMGYGSGTPSMSDTSHWVDHRGYYPFHLPRFDVHPVTPLPPGTNDPECMGQAR